MKLNDSQAHVTIRQITSADRDALVLLANNVKVANNLRDDFPHPYTLKDAENFILHANKTVPIRRFCIEFNGDYVGNIGLHPQDDVYARSAELGYFIGEPYWGKGIATSAVKLIVNYGFEVLGIHRIYAGVFSYNKASSKVLEKAGFTFEGISKDAVCKNGQFFDEIRYAKINPEAK